MKHSKIFLGLAACCAMIATSSCSQDEPVADNIGNGVAPADQTYYLRVTITNATEAGGRAENNNTNFDLGTPDESQVNNLQFRFYDAAGKAITPTTPTTKYEFVSNSGNPTYPNVINVATAIVQIGLEQGQNLPAYVVCSVNPIDWSTVEAGSLMSDLRNLKRNTFRGTNDGFSMNNSAYYGDDLISGASDVKMTGAPILANQLHTSKEAANASSAAAVDIFVERMAAKVKFAIAENAISAQTIGGYEMTFQPTGWGITADANDMYAVKRFSIEKGDNAPIPTVAEIDGYLGTGWGNTYWNDETLRRSYWGCSPSFYATKFPQVSDNITDKATDGTTGAGKLVGDYKLKYYSYNQITGANGNPMTKNTIYTMENTMGKGAFTLASNPNPKAAAPSVLLVGKYKIDGIAENTTFYKWNNQVYFSSVPTGAAADAKTITNAMLELQDIIATDATGTRMRAIPPGVTMEVKHPDKAIREELAIPENWVTLQLTSLPTGSPLFYKPAGSQAWIQITTDAQMKAVNSALCSQLNYANAYTNGMAYFTIPIQHLRATEDTTNSPFTKDAAGNTTGIDWSKVRIGDFGLVRNHSYDLSVNGITGIGGGIFNPEAPIVTPMDSYNYYIKYRLNILSWRIVPKQGVIL